MCTDTGKAALGVYVCGRDVVGRRHIHGKQCRHQIKITTQRVCCSLDSEQA
jgi:hypothetical protein